MNKWKKKLWTNDALKKPPTRMNDWTRSLKLTIEKAKEIKGKSFK